MSTKLCERCKRRIKAEAISCICGWGAAFAGSRPFIACGYEVCQREAICRIWTSTGWLNVCLEHYKTGPNVNRVSTSAHMVELREAYQRRLAAKLKEAA